MRRSLLSSVLFFLPWLPTMIGASDGAPEDGRTLRYSTFLGGSGLEETRSAAADEQGNLYVTGHTTSPDFLITPGSLQTPRRGSDIFVVKLSPTGSIIYSAVFGGSSDEIANGIAVDRTGSAYVTGRTFSPDFPSVNPVLAYSGSGDAFVTKLNAAGSSIIYSTFLGGAGSDEAFAIAVDGTGSAYVAGGTFSLNFPTRDAVQVESAGGSDAFISVLSPFGTQLLYSSFLGGSSNDLASGLALDSGQGVAITGSTFSRDFPTRNAPQPAFGGAADAFVTLLSAAGDSLIVSTYFGGHSADYGRAVAVDSADNIYVTGTTLSLNFPVTASGLAPPAAPGADVVVVKVSPAGSLLFSTRLGGAGNEEGFGISVDSAGQSWVTGYTSSIDFPVAAATQRVFGGGTLDAFVTALNGAGSALVFSTFLGGSGDDYGFTLAGDRGTGLYFGGLTSSANFPTVNAAQPNYKGGSRDAFAVQIGSQVLRSRRRP